MRRKQLAIPVICAVVGGCSMIRRDPSPQQRFLDALQRGNGTEASTVWVQMSGEQRAALSHGIGIKQSASADDVKAQLMKREADSAPDDSATGVFDMGDESVEVPGLKASSRSSLQNLGAAIDSAQ